MLKGIDDDNYEVRDECQIKLSIFLSDDDNSLLPGLEAIYATRANDPGPGEVDQEVGESLAKVMRGFPYIYFTAQSAGSQDIVNVNLTLPEMTYVAESFTVTFTPNPGNGGVAKMMPTTAEFSVAKGTKSGISVGTVELTGLSVGTGTLLIQSGSDKLELLVAVTKQ